MKQFNLSSHSFLVVDDERISRLSTFSLLKSLGCKTIYYAASGKEALSNLEDESKQIDGVITDFKMPDMNGLQLLRSIRVGLPHTPRELPVFLLSEYDDPQLLTTANEMDINGIIPKPPQKKGLIEIFSQWFSSQKSPPEWLKSPRFYKRIDIDSPVANLLKDDPSSIKQLKERSIDGVEMRYHFDEIPVNSTLSRDIQTKNGKVLYAKETQLTGQDLIRLKGLKDLGFCDGTAWVYEGNQQTSTNGIFQQSEAQTSSDSKQRSSLSLYGRLNYGDSVNCTRCHKSFTPDQPTLRNHNKGQLHYLYCEDCTRRENELICACVRYMIMLGGFPLTLDQFLDAYYERGEQLTRNQEDPFEKLRDKYKAIPLSKKDLINWANIGYFIMNPTTKQIECKIDRIMSDPERVKLLGKEGIEAKKMATQKAMLQLKT